MRVRHRKRKWIESRRCKKRTLARSLKWGDFWRTRKLLKYKGPYPDWELELPKEEIENFNFFWATHLGANIRNRRGRMDAPLVIRVFTDRGQVAKIKKYLSTRIHGLSIEGRWKRDLPHYARDNS